MAKTAVSNDPDKMITERKGDIRIPLDLLHKIIRDNIVGDATSDGDPVQYKHTTDGGNVVVAQYVPGVESIDFWTNPED